MKGLPNFPLPSKVGAKVEVYKEWDRWACNQLMSTGSELHGKFNHLQVNNATNVLFNSTICYLYLHNTNKL